MADLFPGLVRRVLPRLGQSPARDGGLRTWFTRGSYTGGLDPNTSAVVLSNITIAELIEYISFDFERFAMASWESFLVSKLEREDKNLVAWPLLKLYYSAFFSAHAIMRSTGSAIVKIDREQIDAINMMVEISTGTSPQLKAGMFLCAIREVRPGQIQVVVTPHTDGAGVHDGFWKAFCLLFR